MQSCAFSIKMEDEAHYLHEYIYGSKVQFFLDHPIWESRILNIITRIFMCWYWIRRMPISSGVSTNRMRFFSPAGMEAGEDSVERIYDLSFIGTYGGYEVQLQWIPGTGTSVAVPWRTVSCLPCENIPT